MHLKSLERLKGGKNEMSLRKFSFLRSRCSCVWRSVIAKDKHCSSGAIVSNGSNLKRSEP